MNSFLLDVWHDLRQKKLWPVAAVLAAALLLVPVVLLRGPSPSEPSDVPAGGQGPAASGPMPGVSLEAAADRTPSRLDVFGSQDPFSRPSAEPGQRSTAVDGSVSELASGSSELAAGGSLGGSSSDPFGSLGASAGGSASAGTPSSEGPAGGSAGPGTPDSSAPSGDASGAEQPKLYNFQADVRFGLAGRERDLKNVDRFTPLPNELKPYVVFLGVSNTGKSAVFMVDTDKVKPAGEGKCKPNPELCTFVYLRDDDKTDQEAFIDEEGRRYNLRLVDIELVAADIDEKVSQSPADQGSTTETQSREPNATDDSSSQDQSEEPSSQGSSVKGARAPGGRGRGGSAARDALFPLIFDLFKRR